MEEKQVNEKTEKAKKAKNRTSLKNIIGGDILATDFFSPSDEVARNDNAADYILYTQSLCLPAANDRD